jgi:tRNA-uridine 2-sulfurtransferase
VSSTTAVALLSGGLDSTLAAKVMLEQGATVVGINFAGVYCPRPLAGQSNAEKAAGTLGIELVTLPIDAEFIAMVKNPKHGRGKNMNPCIDCHTLMIRKAWTYCQTRGGQFVITGEVLGQRPMSQNFKSLAEVARESGSEGRLVRPLSAKLLPETEPEKAGLVDRSRLLDIQGRSRKRQMALAAQYGIKEYPAPAGGCLLTEKVFSARLAEAFEHGEDSLEILDLLRFGRHFRLESGARVIVGRDMVENDELQRRAAKGAVILDATEVPGPLGLLISDSRLQIADCRVRDEELMLAARICAAYSDRRKDAVVTVKCGGEELAVAPASDDDLTRLRIA